jgi:SAM-dependent methyltransferase
MSISYWMGPTEDEAMQDEHAFIWRAIIKTIDIDLAGKRVLDAGCNRGGFLRLLNDRCGIAEGFGYDPAGGAIDDARRLADGRPVRFMVSNRVPSGWSGFDVAFSHEVLYLIEDIAGHAHEVFDALAPGGVYYAVVGVHTASPMMGKWHQNNAQALNLPPLYDLDDIVAAFVQAGFDASAARLAIDFMPAADQGHHGKGSLLDWLDYYNDHKPMLRFRRPPAAST